MGINSYTYVGPYIKIDVSKPIEYLENKQGCKKCNTTFVENFCSKCGSRRVAYETKMVISKPSAHDCLSLVFKKYQNLDKDSVTNSIDASRYDNTIISNIIGKHIDNEMCPSYVIDLKSASDLMDKFKNDNKDVMNKMAEIGIKLEVVYGVVVYCN